jgi:nitrate/TMAO reductase-like tetraheme cytochrome c subunit
MKTRTKGILGALALLAAGAAIGVPTVDYADRYFSTDKFCATSCHVMEATVYKEFQESVHGTTATGVRPTCADCHVSPTLPAAMWDHFLGMRDLYVFWVEGVRTPEKFEEVRARAADLARFALLRSDSATCRSCHVMEAIVPERNRGKTQHKEALEEGTTCIVCHYNLVHKEVEPSEKFLLATEK